MKTGIKFKPCNVGTAEAHNRREQKYIDAINRKYGKTYFWTERTQLNESWRNSDYADSLSDTLEQLKVLVKQKTGRAMQMKSHERVDRKTGKVKVIAGSSAIREGCPPIKPDTTIEDFAEFKAWLASKNITLISIDLHRDEGHIDEDSGELKVNNHAHIIVDWIDHQTGKSVKLSKSDCEEMQTVLARSLGMERGTPKQDTGIEGLNAIEYKEKMAQQHYQELQQKNASLENDNTAKQQQRDQLDAEIKEKTEKANRENGSKILEGGAAIGNTVAHLFGKGKYAQLEAENARLQEKINEFPVLVKQEAKKLTKTLSAKLDKANKANENTKFQYDLLRMKYDSLMIAKDAQEEKLQKIIDEKDYEIKHIEARLQTFLKGLEEKCQNAISAIVDYATSIFDIFTHEHYVPVRDYIFASPNKEKSANMLLFFSQLWLTGEQQERAKDKVQKVLNGYYDRKAEKQEQRTVAETHTRDDSRSETRSLPDYRQPRTGHVPMDIHHDGEAERFYVPAIAKKVWNDEFDYRFTANCDELTNMAAAIFVGLLLPQAASENLGGGTSNDMPWRDKNDDDERWARRCAAAACQVLGKHPKRGRCR